MHSRCFYSIFFQVSEGVADAGDWVGVLTRLACDAAALVLPPSMVSTGVLDPRHYIKVWGCV
jgi:hypothetical protein